jgi:16S rRNA (adenine1518-N6/adenine1519-N6)-dimethyltransferase
MTHSHRPRKRFGQHFLADDFILQHMAKTIAPQADQFFVEIGPGQGALTQFLVDKVQQLDVIEIDRDLVSWLTQHYQNKPQFHCHSADVLTFDFATLQQQHPLRIVGNLPYNISTPLLFKLFEHINMIQDMFFLLQKEVVDRLTANANSSHYNRLSVMAQYFCDSSELFEVPPEAFSPPPKVNSAFVYLKPIVRKETAHNFEQFSALVKQAFCYRRKTITNGLKGLITAEQLQDIDIDPKTRPQQLSVNDYIRIANSLT